MNFYDRPQTLLEDRISDRRRSCLIFALTVALLGLSSEVFSQPIKVGYALSPELRSPFGWQRRAGIFQSTA
jgi:hypothetical protein